MSKKTNIKPSETPKARLIPMPPLLLKDETETAIIVKIKTDNGVVHLLYLTKRCSFIRIDPLTFSSAVGGSAASLGNVGPAIGSLGPSLTYEGLSAFAKIWCSFLMLVGRLELFTFLIIFTPYFWRKI